MLRRFSEEVLILFVLFSYIFFYVVFDFTNLSSYLYKIPKEVLNMNTIFIGLFLEALPFVIVGIIISSFIQVFVTPEMIQKSLPKSTVFAIIPVALIGIIAPICECGIVPIVRSLVKKGMPLHIGVVFLSSVPIINPIVFTSTFYAFQSNLHIAILRLGLAFIVVLLIGLMTFLFYGRKNVLIEDSFITHSHSKNNRWKEVFAHSSDEFFSTCKFLLMGALIASILQTSINRDSLLALANHEYLSSISMMGLGYILSLCSGSDAFIAASFSSTFHLKSILAFLLFGAMIDIKNTFMMFSYFKRQFVLFYILSTAGSVYLVTFLWDLYFGR